MNKDILEKCAGTWEEDWNGADNGRTGWWRHHRGSVIVRLCALTTQCEFRLMGNGAYTDVVVCWACARAVALFNSLSNRKSAKFQEIHISLEASWPIFTCFQLLIMTFRYVINAHEKSRMNDFIRAFFVTILDLYSIWNRIVVWPGLINEISLVLVSACIIIQILRIQEVTVGK